MSGDRFYRSGAALRGYLKPLLGVGAEIESPTAVAAEFGWGAVRVVACGDNNDAEAA